MKLRSRGGLVAGLLALAAIAAPARATPFEATLSFSIESAIGSPIETLSPSFLSQRATCPSSMVGDSFGMTTWVAIVSEQ